MHSQSRCVVDKKTHRIEEMKENGLEEIKAQRPTSRAVLLKNLIDSELKIERKVESGDIEFSPKCAASEPEPVHPTAHAASTQRARVNDNRGRIRQKIQQCEHRKKLTPDVEDAPTDGTVAPSRQSVRG